MKKFKLFKLLALFVVLITSINAWGQTYKPARVDERKAMPVVTMQGAGMQSQQMMSGGAYNGTVYEPFSNATPSEASNPAKAPGGPRKDQASGRNPGEVDPDAASNQSPIGEPWIMLLMALLFGGMIAIRKYKQKFKTTENNDATMKNHLSFKLLALFIVLINSINSAWAYNMQACTVYFDNSQWKWEDVKMYIWNDKGNNTWTGNKVLGSDYYKIDVTKWDNFTGFKFFTGSWTHQSNELHDELNSGWYTLCFDTDNQTWTIVGPKNVGIENTTTTYGGDGNSSETPYIVEAGTAITCRALGDVIDGNTSLRYSFNTGSGYVDYGNSATYTVSSIPEHNATYQVKVKVKTIRDSYNSREFETATIYYKAINIHKGLTASASPAAAASAGYPTISATYVNAGSTVDVAAGSPKTGYSWDRWSSSNGSFGTATNASTTFQPSADNAAAVANFTENKSSITINAATLTPGTGGSVTTGSGTNISLGIATSRAVVASDANTNYYFTGWIVDGHAVVDAPSSKSTSVRTDGYDGGTGTATATYSSRYAIAGSDTDDKYGAAVNGMPGWGDGYPKTIDYDADNSDYRLTLTLKGNTSYKFKVRDKDKEAYYGVDASSVTIEGETKWFNASTNDATFTLNGSDDVIFKIVGNGGDHVQIHIQTSDGYHTAYTAAYNSQTFYGNNTNETSTNGGTVAAIDGKGFPLKTGEKVKAGGSVTFTATKKDGYSFAGWYSDAACTIPLKGTSGASVSGEDDKILTLSGISANKTVYAKFTENMADVLFVTRGKGKIYIETAEDTWTESKDLTPTNRIKVGVHTTYNIKAVAEEGKGEYFAKWDKVAAVDDFQLDDDEEEDYGEDNPEAVLKGKGIGGTEPILYAHFYELDKIYFRNVNASTGNKLWTNVFVYFDVSWEGDCAKSKDTDDAYYIGEMTEISDTKVYKAYVPRAFTRKVGDNHDGNIAFSNHNFGKNYKFNGYEGLKWASYTKSLDMCVPTQSDYDYDYTRTNQTKYYKSYWKKSYDYEGFLGGYYLKQYTGSGYSYALPHYNFTIVDENTIQTTFYIKNATKDYAFMIESAGGLRYITQDSPSADVDGKDVYANACSAVTMTEWNSGSPRFTVHPNMEGEYIFTIDQSGEKMKLTVEYPVSVGDYRIKHTYGADKEAYSNAVKAAKVADTDTVSLFLSNEGTPATVLQKCMSIDADTKMPEWSDLNSTNLSDFNSQEPGVYKAGLTITNDAVSNTPVIEAYTGNYYIHVNAKTKNYLTTDGYPRSGNSVGTKFTKFVKNSAFGDTYDYYWVDWFQKVNDSEEPSYERITEAQSVVATVGNDYNIDLAGELGDDDYSVDGKTTTDGANVRYGYDSKSNTFTRAMITGAGSSIKIANSQEAEKVKILTTLPSTYTDCYESPQSASDADNWMYEFTAQVKPRATASITSSYNDVAMTLANNQKLIEGSGTDAYDLKIIYDFRTNRLITAWIPNPSTSYSSEIDLDANMMVVRAADNADDRPTVLNLATGGALNNIKQIYTVMEFTKENWADGAWTVTAGGYKDAYFWISLPYDCYISDIFGISDYGSEDGSNWVIQTYRGDLRAEKGWWAETESWWYDMERNDIMKANQGYVIRLTNLDNYGKPFYESGDISKLQLYFPSANNANLSIGLLGESTTVNYPEIKCTIVRDEENHAGDPNYDRRAIDSNWRIIGSPCFNSAKISTEGWGDTYPTSPDVKGNLQFFYTWAIDAGKPKYTIQNASAVSSFEFKATHAYFVQYAGDITWVPYNTTPFVGFKAPARAQEENTDQTLCLVLNKNGEQADVTYIKRMEEGATEGYDLNKDLSKVMNGRMANLYTIAGYYKMGGNCLPDTTSIVPVGVRTAVAGEYTFSMPEGTNGTGVYLIDNVAGTRTNLALTDYTVNLAAGTYDGRFMLELSPIAQTPTDVEHTSADVVEGVRKVMVDGVLYIVKDGKVFDARGNRVQ